MCINAKRKGHDLKTVACDAADFVELMPLSATGNPSRKRIKALFTSREGSPSARVTLAGGSKIARVYKQNFTGRVTLPPGTT